MQFSIHFRKVYQHFLVLSFAAIAVFVTGCETPTNSIESHNQEELTSELTFSPLPYETSKFLFNPSKSGVETAKSQDNSEPPFGCVMSTLNSPNTDFAYSYHAVELTFPGKILEKAKGKSHVRVFMIANDKAGEHAGSFRGTENVVRMARCRIPAVKQVDSMLDKALRNFDSGTWLDTAMNNTKGKSLSKFKSSGSYEWVCTSRGTMNYWGYDEETGSWALYVTYGCTSGYYNYVEEQEDGSGGGGAGGSGGDPSPPCNDPTMPCIEGGGDGGGDTGLTEEEIREQDLKNLLESDEFALLEVPCEEIPKWQELAQYEVPQTVLDRLEDTDALSGSFIQKLEDASGAVVNMDNFSVTVPGNEIPNSWTAEEYLDHIRTNLNAYIDNSISIFEPYPGLNDEVKWNGQNPLGSVFSIQLTPDLPDFIDEDGTVIASGIGDSFWIFSTLYTTNDGYHPVSGNRLFGFTDNEDGSFTFYTKGVDRLSTSFYDWANWAAQGVAFDTADDLWSSFQEKIKDDFGSSAILDSTTYRPNYSDVEDALNGDAPIASIAGCE